MPTPTPGPYPPVHTDIKVPAEYNNSAELILSYRAGYNVGWVDSANAYAEEEKEAREETDKQRKQLIAKLESTADGAALTPPPLGKTVVTDFRKYEKELRQQLKVLGHIKEEDIRAIINGLLWPEE